VAASDKEIRDLNAKYENVEAQIRKQSPHYAALIKPKPLSIPDIQQQALDPDSLLLEYALGDERSYLWAVTRDQVKSYELAGRAEIEEAARNVHSLLIANQPIQGETLEERHGRVVKANEQLPSQIANLSKKLLAAVSGELGTKRLLIVPDGALQYIPFQVLTASDDQRPLVIDHEIVNEPSASALALLVSEIKNRKPATKSVAVLADPVFESDDPRISSASRANPKQANRQAQETEFHQALQDVNLSGDGHIPRLLASRVEAKAIMAVTPWRSGFEAMDFDASRATVTKTDLSNYRIVHFATHGLLNNEHPELSGIVLSLFDQNGQPQDGYLRLHDIYNLKLPVDLVVLSACNTGLGKDVKGEGLIGLTRGFMYAGASSVVASLWKVDDEATSELMRIFYGYMLRDGLSPAAALRKAQVTMSQQKPWQSPYYWAGFVIEGQYIPNERVNRFSSQRLVLLLIAAVLLSVTAFYALRRRRKIPL
jgi:CHAT domain-containing protein